MLMYGLPGPLVFWFESLVDAQGPVFGPLSKVFVILSDSQHRVFRFRIIHFICEKARFFCAGAPVLGLINEVANQFLPPSVVASLHQSRKPAPQCDPVKRFDECCKYLTRLTTR